MFLYLYILAGLAVAAIFHFQGVQNQQWYLLTVATLLAAGLYSSTYGISIKEARRHVGLILRAVTIGVLFKALLIGGIMTAVLQNPFGFVLGIIVAQIDPLSTAGLMKGSRLSKKAKSILAAWSSFDDPVTVIMSLYVPILVALLLGTHWQPIRGTMQEAGLFGYLAETGINLLFAGGIFILWRLMKRHSRASNYLVVGLVALGMYGLFIGSLSIAVYYFWMLGIALLGLFMRPPIEAAVTFTVRWALSIAAVLLGILLINGVNILPGMALGVAAFVAQVVVGLLLTGKLPKKDRWHIALAQQNGITAIILALLFETYYPGTIAIVGPAIIVTNTTHRLANMVLDMHLAHSFEQITPKYQLGKLRAHMRKI